MASSPYVAGHGVPRGRWRRLPGICAVDAAFAIAVVTWKEWAAYRSHMAVSLVTGPLRFLVMTWIWRSTTSAATGGQGATESLVLYSGLAVLVGYAVMDFSDWNLQMLVRTGRYATQLLYPLPHPWFSFSQKLGHRFLSLLIEILPVWCLVSLFLGKPLVPCNLGWFLLSVAQGFVLMFFINYAVGLTGFWLVRAEGVRRCLLVVRDTMSGAWIPLSFFPGAFQSILFLSPYPWAMYVPLRIAMGNLEIHGQILSAPLAVALQSVALLAWGSLALAATKFANRRFLAAGG